MQPEPTFNPVEVLPGVVMDIRACQSDFLGIARVGNTWRLVSTRRIDAGTSLFKIDGERTHRPTRYSVQVGEDLHIDLGRGHSESEILDRFYWRFMNHSCEPNTRLCAEDAVATRDIEPFEDVTFDYNTTEYEIAEPFDCHCGSSTCLGRIRGFKYLTPEQRIQRGPSLRPYLRRLAGLDAKTEPT